MIDLTSKFGIHVAQRLDKEIVIWLTTVGADGTPQPSPVWFLWADQAFLIYSRPNTPKLRNIERSPRVALNFDSDGQGGDIVVFTGEARIDPQAPPAHEIPAYLKKYREHIAGINMTPDHFARGYSVALRIVPTKLRGH